MPVRIPPTAEPGGTVGDVVSSSAEALDAPGQVRGGTPGIRPGRSGPWRSDRRHRAAPRLRRGLVGTGTLGPAAVLVVAVAVLGVVLAASLVAGSRVTGIGEVLSALAGAGDSHIRAVVDARIPRTLLGAAVGGALAVSGVLIQGLTRNPLAEPGLLGVSMGASAGVVTATAFLGFTGGQSVVWVAMPGGVLAVIAVYALGRRSRDESVIPLILAGAVVTAVLGAYIQAMILTRPEVFDSFRHWVVGSLAGASLSTLTMIAPALIAGLVLAMALTSSLNALALGEQVATSLGVRVVPVRIAGLAAATLLAAAATAAVGPIAFVGLAVPHMVRSVVGTDHRWQVPLAVICGAMLLVAADSAARVVARPEELMVGVVTAFVGAPFLLAAVRRGKVTG